MTLKSQFRIALLPADDLGLESRPERYLVLGEDVMPVLSAIFGQGPNVPRLITVDDAGRILLGSAGALVGAVQIQDGLGSGLQAVVIGTSADNVGTGNALRTQGMGYAFNGTGFDRLRDASAANLNNQLGIGALLTSIPGLWQAVSNPAAGTQASATRAAGGAGVRHIAAALVITFGAIAAPVATALTWALRDGVSGAGAILAQGQVAVPAAAFQTVALPITDIAIPGSAATAMTLEFSAGLANLLEGVTLLGYDAS